MKTHQERITPISTTKAVAPVLIKDLHFLSDELQPLAIELDQHGQPLPRYRDWLEEAGLRLQQREHEPAVLIPDQSKTPA